MIYEYKIFYKIFFTKRNVYQLWDTSQHKRCAFLFGLIHASFVGLESFMCPYIENIFDE